MLDMPVFGAPATVSVEALERKREAAKDSLWVDCGFIAGCNGFNTNELDDLIHQVKNYHCCRVEYVLCVCCPSRV